MYMQNKNRENLWLPRQGEKGEGQIRNGINRHKLLYIK